MTGEDEIYHERSPNPASAEIYGGDDSLWSQIATVLNRHSAESASNTPDFILAEYLKDCLRAFDRATNARGHWWGAASNWQTMRDSE